MWDESKEIKHFMVFIVLIFPGEKKAHPDTDTQAKQQDWETIKSLYLL